MRKSKTLIRQTDSQVHGSESKLGANSNFGSISNNYPFKPNGIYHRYQLDNLFPILGVLGEIFHIFFSKFQSKNM